MIGTKEERSSNVKGGLTVIFNIFHHHSLLESNDKWPTASGHSPAMSLPRSKRKTEGEYSFHHHSPAWIERQTALMPTTVHRHSPATSLPHSKHETEGECILHHHFPPQTERQTALTPTTATPLLERTDRKAIHAHHHHSLAWPKPQTRAFVLDSGVSAHIFYYIILYYVNLI